jgi:hypothetical protein
MRRLLRRLWADDRASGLIQAEWLFLFTVLVLGLITGLIATRQSLLSELAETADALMALNQSFEPSGRTNCESSTGGSSGSDTTNTISFGSVSASTASINQSACD